MRRPGFAHLYYRAKNRSVEVVRMSNVNNKTTKKPHGQMLGEIACELKSYLREGAKLLLVREQGFFKHARETQVLCKVIGVSD